MQVPSNKHDSCILKTCHVTQLFLLVEMLQMDVACEKFA
jgi:hypothetical protein